MLQSTAQRKCHWIPEPEYRDRECTTHHITGSVVPDLVASYLLTLTEVGNSRSDGQNYSTHHHYPEILLNQVSEVGTSNHPDQDATPLQQTNIQPPPYLCPE